MHDIIINQAAAALQRIAEAKESITDPQLLAALEELEQAYMECLDGSVTE